MVDCGGLEYSVRQAEEEVARTGTRGCLQQYPTNSQGTSTTGMRGLILAPTPALRRRLKGDRDMPALPYNQE